VSSINNQDHKKPVVQKIIAEYLECCQCIFFKKAISFCYYSLLQGRLAHWCCCTPNLPPLQKKIRNGISEIQRI